MTKSTIARERLQEIAEDGFLKHGESKELARMALAAMDRDQVRSEHAEWSQATFGNVGPVGPLKHLSKEALEAAAEPGDLSEWADMQFLLWDAQRRADITDEQITQAMIEKLAVNKQREWPEPKDGEPRLHIKAQPAPVVSADLLHTAASAIEDLLTTKDRTGAGMWFDLPFQLRSAANAQQALVVPEDVRHALSKMDDEITAELNAEESAYRAAMLQAGNSPVIPDGYVMVPMRLTAENGAKWELSGEFSETSFVNCPECFGDDECETCDGSGRIGITVPVTWTTIKEIWAKGVEHFAATQQGVPGE